MVLRYKSKKPAPNRSVYASPPYGGSGSVRLGRLRLPRLTPPQFAVAGLCFAKPLYATTNRHIQPERCATFELVCQRHRSHGMY